MTPKELSKKLFTITDSEEKYRKGISSKKIFPLIEINNQTVLQFSYSAISIENNGIPFLVKKHSRFRDYPLHVHDWIEISYMYSGSCTQVIEGKKYKMEKGQLLLMVPNTIHTIEKLGENDVLIQIALGQKNLTTNFFNRLSSSSIVSRFFINAFNETHSINKFYLFESENSRRLELFINEFLCEYYDPSIANLDILNNLFSLIITELVNVMNITSDSINNDNEHVLPILHYIENNYRTCSLTTTSKEFGLNANYMSNLLKKYTRYTFNQLVVDQRLTTAEHLLISSDMSVTDIANYVGYQNMSFFYKIFIKKYNYKPSEYRNLYSFKK